METMIFLKGFGIATLIIAFFGGLLYWMIVLIKKVKPDLKYSFRYKVLKKKINEDQFKTLLQYYDAKQSKEDVEKLLFLSNKFTPDEIGDLCYLYKQIIKKGGTKNE